ncbi:MAG: type I 3-dehydroquinate dehydratase [Planctomyces sp.]|nr:type I 3-dehydroquinate dehydratase [Planctomyces sp.]
MICITVTPESRKFGKVDILNAARKGDIIEVCLDRLLREPDIKDLLSVTDKPIIVSCRRREDGGQWDGTEEERLMLLRQAIVAGPAYIELDLAVAGDIKRFGKTQRVISFTRLDRPEPDLDAVFDEASQAQADVVKFTWPTPTIDDAWPLLRAVSQKKSAPIVGIGLGRAELTFSLLGYKYGSPWIYAALEKGMEAFEGQATVFELEETYALREIDRHTGFVAVAGGGDSQTSAIRVLNSGFRELGMNVRCLPVVPGEVASLKKMLDALKIRAVVVGGEYGAALLPLADTIDPLDRSWGFVDLLLRRDDGWHGYSTLWRSGLKALESTLGKGADGKGPLAQRSVLVLGNGAVAYGMAAATAQRGGLVSLCGPSDKESQQSATKLGCRFVPFQNLYDTLADVAIIADRGLEVGSAHGCINAAVLRPQMTVLDVSDPPVQHELFVEARLRGCKLVSPEAVSADRLAAQFKGITGQELSAKAQAAGAGAVAAG